MRERVRKPGIQSDKASFANYSLPAKHGISHHTRCFISLADFNCEDPAASVDFTHLWNPPASLPLHCFSWLMVSSKSSCSPPLLPWGIQIAQTHVIPNGGLKREVLTCADVCVCAYIYCACHSKKRPFSSTVKLTWLLPLMSEGTRWWGQAYIAARLIL